MERQTAYRADRRALLASAVVAALVCAALLLLGLFSCHVSSASSAGDSAGAASTVTVHFIDVGQGDSELLVLEDGTTVLIDAGDAEHGGVVISYLRDELGVSRIDVLVATHPDADHIGGIPEVLEALEVGEVVAPEVTKDTETFDAILASAVAECGGVTPAWAGMVLHDSGGCRLEVLSPREGADYGDVNDWSVVLRLTYGSTSMLFTGDASYSVVESLGVGHVDVLKVGHHGSDTATSIPLLEELTPTDAVIEVGAGNDYGHPTMETLDELAWCDVRTWRTDLDGTVIATSDGYTVTVSTASGGYWPAEAPEPEAVDGSQTVYVTRTGTKYHRDDCEWLTDTSRPMTVDEALAAGYTACSVCF